MVMSVLTKIRDGDLSLKMVGETCRSIKKLNVIKQLFLKQVAEKKWAEAVTKYPHHTKDEQLSVLISLPIKRNGPVHPALISYCQKAMRSICLVNGQQGEDIILFKKESKMLGAISTLQVEDITYPEISRVIPQFSGFTLTIGSLCGDCETESQAITKVK